MDQTCLFYNGLEDACEARSLVVYLPHISSPEGCPFYHPAVRGIGFLHKFESSSQTGSVSIHYLFFESEPRSTKLERTAQHLLAVTHKHGQGTAAGYVKRVKHDVILPQGIVQNTYSRLKTKYARDIIEGWVEATDPGKHVFEDLSIAAFLIELWADMYRETDFPGFVDIGCGNGLLVHILLEEGYPGWGFDARKRKSWATYGLKAQEKLKELVLIPSIIRKNGPTTPDLVHDQKDLRQPTEQSRLPDEIHVGKSVDPSANETQEVRIHDGIFPRGTFIISNHADELTPWTPVLANISESPFMMIPCCSHALSGARFRAPPPKDADAPKSAYASLVAWISRIATECGWEVEKEMLRIPSTRNTALIGRRRSTPFTGVNLRDLIALHGGAARWEENALKLVKITARGH